MTLTTENSSESTTVTKSTEAAQSLPQPPLPKIASTAQQISISLNGKPALLRRTPEQAYVEATLFGEPDAGRPPLMEKLMAVDDPQFQKSLVVEGPFGRAVPVGKVDALQLYYRFEGMYKGSLTKLFTLLGDAGIEVKVERMSLYDSTMGALHDEAKELKRELWPWTHHNTMFEMMMPPKVQSTRRRTWAKVSLAATVVYVAWSFFPSPLWLHGLITMLVMGIAWAIWLGSLPLYGYVDGGVPPLEE